MPYQVSYNDTNFDRFPRINFSLVNNYSYRLSNKRHNRKIYYQVDFFSDRALDVEDDKDLMKIIELLEDERLLTTDWVEVSSIDEVEQQAIYHYYIEVR